MVDKFIVHKQIYFIYIKKHMMCIYEGHPVSKAHKKLKTVNLKQTY